MQKESTAKIFIVATLLCLVCSVLVSGAAVVLRPAQEKNAELFKKRNILAAAGMYQEGKSVDELFANIEAKMVDLATGEFTDKVDVASFDIKSASRNPKLSKEIEADKDYGGNKRRPLYAPVYLVKENEEITKIILPVYGKGLWSTLYGFLALKGDAQTIAGLAFYEHGETPGLGGEVDNPRWKALWPDKLAFDKNGRRIIEVLKGQVNPNSSEANHQVDGMSGATITTRGVHDLIRYWLEDDGFGPFLKKYRQGA